MVEVTLAHEVDWQGWRDAARRLALGGTRPEDVVWKVLAPDDLFARAETSADPPAPVGTFSVPRALVALAETVIQAREPERFALLYRLIWRAHSGQRDLLTQMADPDLDQAHGLAHAVTLATRELRAALRFREIADRETTRPIAWFDPAHFIVEANIPFFVRNHSAQTWSILTPYRSAHWTGTEAIFADGAKAEGAPDDARLAVFWRDRFGTAGDHAGRPPISWKNLPSPAAMPDQPDDSNSATTDPPLRRAAREAASCRRCPLWEPATQIVFGEGPPDAALMLVGEQPGDQEDLAGRPFVGPAGQMLDRALREAGIDRGGLYVTNAVKHFKFEPRGRRRIHATPDAGEIAACRFWLDLERAEVKPRIILLMGASAARAVLGRAVTISRERGRPIALGSSTALVTVHPSYLLRLPDEAARQREYAAFVVDLRQAAALCDAAK